MHDGRSFTWEELEAEEERMERTPRSADRHGPAPPADHRPKGPPPPRPIHEHEDPACAQPVAGTGDRWERDHSLGPQPTAWVERDGKRTIARVSGPLLPNGRFEDDRREDQVDSSGSEDLVRELSEESAAATGDEANSTSGNSMSWSDTSLVLEGPSLRQARGQLVAFFRGQILQTEPGISSRSMAGKVGALRRLVDRGNWSEVQRLARLRLQGERLQRWQRYEYEATHEYRPKRIRQREE